MTPGRILGQGRRRRAKKPVKRKGPKVSLKIKGNPGQVLRAAKKIVDGAANASRQNIGAGQPAQG